VKRLAPGAKNPGAPVIGAPSLGVATATWTEGRAPEQTPPAPHWASEVQAPPSVVEAPEPRAVHLASNTVTLTVSSHS
jgi:hypothetical protein